MSFRSLFTLSCLGASAGLFGAALSPASAQTKFLTDTTINYTINDTVQIGGQNGVGDPFSPTVHIVRNSGGTGTITGLVFAYNNSAVFIDGGVLYQNYYAVQNSSLVFNSGSVNGVIHNSGTGIIDINGGDFIAAAAEQFGQINIHGGSIGDQVGVYDNATLNIYGTGLHAVLNSTSSGGSFYNLSGFLADGSSLTGKRLFVGSGSPTYNLIDVSAPPVPEPGTLALVSGGSLGVGSLLVGRRRRLAPAKAV